MSEHLRGTIRFEVPATPFAHFAEFLDPPRRCHTKRRIHALTEPRHRCVNHATCRPHLALATSRLLRSTLASTTPSLTPCLRRGLRKLVKPTEWEKIRSSAPLIRSTWWVRFGGGFGEQFRVRKGHVRTFAFGPVLGAPWVGMGWGIGKLKNIQAYDEYD